MSKELNKRIKIFTGQITLNLFLSEKELSKFIGDLQTKKKEWIVLTEVSGNQIQIRNETISAFEVIKSSERKTNDGTIPIKTLADFAGVHPIRITRNLSKTLAVTGGNKREFRRATKETAIALYELLSATGETKRSKSEFLKIFEE